MAYSVSEECIACGTCIDECPVEAISEGDIYKIDSDLCAECGSCAEVCPTDSITIKENEQEEEDVPSIKFKFATELLLYMTPNGKIRAIPIFKDEFGSIIKIEENENLKKAELLLINKKKAEFEQKAEELEYLISKDDVREQELQDFFERNPEFILDGEYCNALPHVILEDNNNEKHIPDFILKPYDSFHVPPKIVELKLPIPLNKIFNFHSREREFSHRVVKAVFQLKRYYRFFTDTDNQKRFFEKYNIDVFSPRLALIIGRTISDVDCRTMSDLKTTFDNIDISTYNDILNKYKQKIKEWF